jgi:glyoxylase-like metal-dependent hydrolase (beta-lactamase superfamily II)
MANAREAELHYPLGDALPALGAALEVAPGVRWVRMQLPFALDHINLWLLRDRLDGIEGWTIVDCGIASPATKSAWEDVFATQLDGLPVLRVIVTHMHPDHMGLADWLTRRWSAPAARLPEGDGDPLAGPREALGARGTHECRLWISATDYGAARLASASTTTFGGDSAAGHFIRHGMVDPESIAKVRARSNYYAAMVPAVPDRYRRLMNGDRVAIGDREWECIAGYGHAPEHISLHCPAVDVSPAAAGRQQGILISGDMVLPRISTNVMVIDLEPEADPLTLYLASLERLRALPEDTLVLPSHGKPFTGLHLRIAQLADHHAERYAEVMAACAERPHSAAEIVPILFTRSLDLHQLTFAMGEAIAHLHGLWLSGRLKRELGADGVFRFAAASPKEASRAGRTRLTATRTPAPARS